MNRLESWKEIADFFNVSVRTVQGWEVEKQLPVHRNPGTRGRVWAEQSELQTWLAAQQTAAPVEPPPPKRRRHLAIALTAVLVVALLAFVVFRRPARTPASVKTDGLSLIAFDDQGTELWRHRLPFVHFIHPQQALLDILRPTFLDLNEDGKPEVLFPLAGDAQKGQNALLLCFSHDGRLLWQFEPGRILRTAAETHPRTYLLRAMTTVNLQSGHPPHLALVSTQSPNFISQVALLDPHGRLVREYWHSGHLVSADASDLNTDGLPELLFTGVSNGYDAATLVVLNPLTLHGASWEDSRNHQILDQGDPVERARLLFPRTRASRIRQRYNEARGVLFTPDQLIVMVRDLTGDICGVSVNYRLSLKLELLAPELADTDKTCYQTLYAARLMPELLDPNDELAELRKIRVLTPWH